MVEGCFLNDCFFVFRVGDSFLFLVELIVMVKVGIFFGRFLSFGFYFRFWWIWGEFIIVRF